MASIRHSTSVASAVCKQTANTCVARPVASVQTYNRAASLSSAARFAACKFRLLRFWDLPRRYSVKHHHIPSNVQGRRPCGGGHQLAIRYHTTSAVSLEISKKLEETVSNQVFLSQIASLLQSSQRLTSASSSSPITYQTRTFLTQLRRQAQALKEQIPSTPTIPSPTKASKSGPTLKLTNLPYFVRRTGSNQLPVYVVTKAGGTKQLTKIQKTEGDLDTLRTDLAHSLGVDPRSPDVSINRLTGHIIVKVLPPLRLYFYI